MRAGLDPAARGPRATRCAPPWPTATRCSPPWPSTVPTSPWSTSGCRRRHTDEGLRAAARAPPPASPHRRAGVLPVHRDQVHGPAAGGRRRRASATCSRTGSPTWPSSPTRWPGSPPAAPPWTRRWSASCCGASRRARGLAALTPREREVLALMAEGRSNAGIAAALVISGGAVEKHVASIFGKLGLPPRTRATTAGCSPSCATSRPERPGGIAQSRPIRQWQYCPAWS